MVIASGKKHQFLSNGNFNMNSVVRKTNHIGGRFALISRNSVKVTLEENSNANTFEYAVWNITIGKPSFQIRGCTIPPSELHKTHISNS